MAFQFPWNMNEYAYFMIEVPSTVEILESSSGDKLFWS